MACVQGSQPRCLQPCSPPFLPLNTSFFLDCVRGVTYYTHMQADPRPLALLPGLLISKRRWEERWKWLHLKGDWYAVSLSKSHQHYLMSVPWALNPGTMGTFSHRCSILSRQHRFLLRLICNAVPPAVCSANAMRQETLKIVLVYADSPISHNTQSLRTSQCWNIWVLAPVNTI